jgi:hypothetical protein
MVKLRMPKTVKLWSTNIPQIFDNLYGRELTIETEDENNLVK